MSDVTTNWTCPVCGAPVCDETAREHAHRLHTPEFLHLTGDGNWWVAGTDGGPIVTAATEYEARQRFALAMDERLPDGSSHKLNLDLTLMEGARDA